MHKWQVLVTILGACVCAVVSVALQGAGKWTLLSAAGVLAVLALYLFVSGPKTEREHAPINLNIHNAPVMTQNQSPVITQKTSLSQAPRLPQPRYEKACLEQKRPKIVWLEMNEWFTFKQSHARTAGAGILLPFYNNPTKSKVEAEFIRAHMILRHVESQEDVSIDAAFWMGQEYHYINLRRGEQGDVLLVVYNARKSEMAVMQDNRSDYRVWEKAGFESATITQLPKGKYAVEIHLIWGGDDQFSDKYSFELDLSDPEELFSSLPKTQLP